MAVDEGLEQELKSWQLQEPVASGAGPQRDLVSKLHLPHALQSRHRAGPLSFDAYQ